jgi:serine/threonine protein kinase
MIAYECLTGRPPFRGSPLAVAHAHMDRPLPPLPTTVPAPVARLVAALTARDPKDRPSDAQAVAEWALRARDYPQVMRAAAGPVRVGVSLLPAESARGMTTSPRRPLSLSSAAAVLRLRATWPGRIARAPLRQSVCRLRGAHGRVPA